MNSLAAAVGRPGKEVAVEVIRELTSADLALIGTGPAKVTSLKKIRDSHHNIARLLAEGKSNAEVSEVTGYGQSRISVLKGDPAFQDLISHYRKDVDLAQSIAFADNAMKMASINGDFLDELQDRLDNQPEAFSPDTILDAIKVLSDRTGLGAQSRSTNVNINLDYAGRVAAGRQRVSRLGLESSPGPVVEGEVVSQPLPLPHEQKELKV